jgi:hypothetical protein
MPFHKVTNLKFVLICTSSFIFTAAVAAADQKKISEAAEKQAVMVDTSKCPGLVRRFGIKVNTCQCIKCCLEMLAPGI